MMCENCFLMHFFEGGDLKSQSVIFSKKYSGFKFCGLLISPSNQAEEGTS